MKPVLQIRRALGLSQQALSAKLGVVQSSVSAYERGAQEISPAVARRLVAVAREHGLDISLDHVYGEAELPPENKAAA